MIISFISDIFVCLSERRITFILNSGTDEIASSFRVNCVFWVNRVYQYFFQQYQKIRVFRYATRMAVNLLPLNLGKWFSLTKPPKNELREKKLKDMRKKYLQ